MNGVAPPRAPREASARVSAIRRSRTPSLSKTASLSRSDSQASISQPRSPTLSRASSFQKTPSLSRQNSAQSVRTEREKLTFKSIARRVRMGKKVERVLREKLTTYAEEDGNKSPEPYQCTGNFFTDYSELCKQSSMERPPSVQPRPRRPPSPNHQVPFEANQHVSSKKGREDKKQQLLQQQQQPTEEEETVEEKELIALFGFKPRSFVAKETNEYMRPSVQVELEQPDKYETVTEIYVRGWKLERTMLDSFRQCFTTLSKLHSLHFWRAAFDSERIKELSTILSQCENIKMLYIDANETLEDENYHELITENSHLTKLQLRYCGISPTGCCRIAQQLGSEKASNSKLLSLDLSGNKIGDVGAVAIAKALRTNRALLHLSLNNNGITDIGCSEISKSLSKFVLTHEEIVSRRYLLSEKGSSERPKSGSPPLGRRDHKDGRPMSVRSTEKGRTSRDGKKGKTRDTKEEKTEKGRGKKEDKPGAKKAAIVGDSSKSGVKAKPKGAKGGKSGAIAVDTPEPVNDTPESRNPLLERVETIAPGQLQIPGNFMLILLNLARNKITEKGVEELLSAVTFQASYLSNNRVNGTGLMKILLKGNCFAEESLAFKRFEEMMLVRDPFYKPPPKTPESEMAS